MVGEKPAAQPLPSSIAEIEPPPSVVLYRKADSQTEEFAGAAEQHADEVRTLKRVIENDRVLLEKGGIGLKLPSQPLLLRINALERGVS